MSSFFKIDEPLAFLRELTWSLRDNELQTVSLTKTRAKGKPRKIKLVEDLRTAIDEYKHIYVFSHENMRTSIFKDIRLHFRESRFDRSA